MANPSDKFELTLEYDSEGRVEYVKKAKPGTKTDASNWQILKLFYDGVTQNILKLSYANNSSLFEHIADDYLFYKYTPVYETLIIPLEKLSAGYIFDLSSGNSDYSLQGETADLLISEALFNNADFITVKEGKRLYDKGSEAIWQGQTSIKLNISSEVDISILIKS